MDADDRTTSTSGTDDAVDRLARQAGAALRRPPSPDALRQLRSARRRHQATRQVAAVAAVAFAATAVFVLSRDGGQRGTVSPVTSTTTAPTTTTPPTTEAPATTVVTDELTLPYTLSGIDGLVPNGVEQHSTAGGSDELYTVWADPRGIEFGALMLRDVKDPGEHSVEGDISTAPLEVPQGEAVVATDNGSQSLPAATRVMWWRGDGRLWVIDNYGIERDRLVQLALAIEPGSGLPHVLASDAMTWVGTGSFVDYRRTSQEWTVNGFVVILSVANHGLAQQFTGATFSEVQPIELNDAAGYVGTYPQGQRAIMWPDATDPDLWYRIDVSPRVTLTNEQLLAAITPK